MPVFSEEDPVGEDILTDTGVRAIISNKYTHREYVMSSRMAHSPVGQTLHLNSHGGDLTVVKGKDSHVEHAKANDSAGTRYTFGYR